MIKKVSGYEINGKIYKDFKEAKKAQLSERLKDMFRNHDIYGAMRLMAESSVCRNLLRQFFDEFDSEES